MEHSIKDLSYFLNNLENNIHEVISIKYARLINNPDSFIDTNVILLYGNKKRYIDMFFNLFLKRLSNVSSLVKQNASFSSEFDYTYSNHHFEFDYSIKSIPFIKSVISNKSITKSQVIFYLKNIDHANKSEHNALVHLLEKYPHIKFFIGSKSLSNIHQNLMSHCCFINLAFDLDKLHELFFKDTMPKDEFKEKHVKKKNLIATFLDEDDNTLEKQIIDMIKSVKKDRSILSCITKIREMCYKLYHLNIPLHWICKIIIDHFKDSKHIDKIVELCASSEHTCAIISKGILAYEKMFIELNRLIKMK